MTNPGGTQQPIQSKDSVWNVPIRWYWVRVKRVIGDESESRMLVMTTQAEMLVRAFYAYLVFLSFPWSTRAASALIAGKAVTPKLDLNIPGLLPVEAWPLANLVSCSAMLAFGLFATLQPRLRWPRIAAALGFVMATAIEFDVGGKVDHGNHAAIWTSIALCFLPVGKPRTATAMRDYLAAFFGAQVLIGMLYSCAGVCKFLGVLHDWSEGATWFNPDALPLVLAKHWARASDTLLAGYFVANPGLCAIAQVVAFVLELCALAAVFERRLHRPLALCLVLLHVSILHSMRIHFHQSCIMLLLMFGASPFAPDWREVWTWLRSLLPSKVRRPSSTRDGSSSDPEADSADSGAQKNVVLPSSRLTRYWLPVLVVSYLIVAFSRYSPSEGKFETDVYPVSAMMMFWRIDSRPFRYDQLNKIRARIEKHGAFPPPKLEPKRKASKGKASKHKKTTPKKTTPKTSAKSTRK